jgi:ECF transporter S component (folate family)
MVKAAFLIAISIVMTRFVYLMLPLAGVSALRISFGDVPLMISGLMFGPLVGGLTGLGADIIGFLINPQGPYHPGFTLSSILFGVIPGIFMLAHKNSNNGKRYSFKRMLLVVGACSLVISLGLNTYWLSKLYGKGFFILLPTRILVAVFSIPIHAFVITYLMKFLRNFSN